MNIENDPIYFDPVTGRKRTAAERQALRDKPAILDSPRPSFDERQAAREAESRMRERIENKIDEATREETTHWDRRIIDLERELRSTPPQDRGPIRRRISVYKDAAAEQERAEAETTRQKVFATDPQVANVRQFLTAWQKCPPFGVTPEELGWARAVANSPKFSDPEAMAAEFWSVVRAAESRALGAATATLGQTLAASRDAGTIAAAAGDKLAEQQARLAAIPGEAINE